MCVSDGQKRAVAARRATVFGFDEARKKKLAKRNVRFRVFQADCSSARKNISAIPYAQTVTDFVTVFFFRRDFPPRMTMAIGSRSRRRSRASLSQARNTQP
jgi:hypothetical protein